jgi:hypothetical protein
MWAIRHGGGLNHSRVANAACDYFGLPIRQERGRRKGRPKHRPHRRYDSTWQLGLSPSADLAARCQGEAFWEGKRSSPQGGRSRPLRMTPPWRPIYARPPGLSIFATPALAPRPRSSRPSGEGKGRRQRAPSASARWSSGYIGAFLQAPASPLSRLAPPRLEVHLAELAMARRRSVTTLAAVTRTSVLRAGIAEAVSVDVAQVPLLAGFDALMTAGAVDNACGHERSECSALGAMSCAVFTPIRSSPLAPPRCWPIRH